MVNIYDYVIVGSGISGLYFAHLLKNKTDNFIILEKKGRMGGRIKTVKHDCFWYEAGATRIPFHHKHILELIKKLGLSHKLFQMCPKKDYNINGKLLNSKRCQMDFKKTTNNIIKYGKKLGKGTKFSNTLFSISNHILNKKIIDDYIIKTGYNSQQNKCNFYNYLKNLKNYNNTKYYKLYDGLIQIIDKLACLIGKDKIKMGHLLQDIKYDNKKKVFNLLVNGKVIRTRKLVCGIMKLDLLKFDILYDYDNLLNSVSHNRYIRIYAKYNKVNGKYWFKNINKTITDRCLRKIIPVDKKNGLIQLCYCDSEYAEMLNNENINGTLFDVIHKNLCEVFPNIKIPKPIYFRAHYWDSGTHWWLPNAESDKIGKKIENIDNNVPLYIIGEAYSSVQGWMEGGIVSALSVFNRIFNEKKKQVYKKYTRKEVARHNTMKDGWVIYRDNVYDVTKWVPLHPGGEVIKYGLGKDISDLFENVGHSNSAHIVMEKYKIGELK